MPSLKIFHGVTLGPFAGDDIQVLCLLFSMYRVIQFCLIIPLSIKFYIRKLESGAVLCNTYNRTFQFNVDTGETIRRSTLTTYNYMTLIFVIADLSLLASIWSAASVGTPTQTTQRDKFLRPLLFVKFFVMNLFLALLIVFGLLLIYYNREDDYGCDEDQERFQDTPWYNLLVVIIFTEALELLVVPWVTINTFVASAKKFIKKNNESLGGSQHQQHTTKCLEICLGGCIKCSSMLCCCGKAGGKGIKIRKLELKDAIQAMRDFVSNDGMIDITFSDMWVAFKTLAYVQRERQLECINNHTSSIEEGTPAMGVDNEATTGQMDRRMQLQKTKTYVLRNGGNYELSYRREPMMANNTHDVDTLKAGAYFMKYAEAVYDSIYNVVLAYLAATTKGALVTFLGLEEDFFLTLLGFEQTLLAYANFQNGIAETPYSVMIDHSIKTVVVSIRGTASLEDMIIDLQLTPASVDAVGKKCGFDGANEFCHKGVLRRSEWVFDDIERHKLLDRFLLGDNPEYPEYALVFTGHSLGAGCAVMVSTMSRKKFPENKCFAFCPPGGLVSHGLAVRCKGCVTSFVNDTDVIPRASLENFERLRDNALEVLARVKVPKIELYYALKDPVNDASLASQNAKLLYSKEETPKDTEYYSQIEMFRAMQNQRGQMRVRLYIPGNIVHVVKAGSAENQGSQAPATQKYLAQWADKREFNEVVLSPTMVENHTCPIVIANLENLVKSMEDGDSLKGEKIVNAELDELLDDESNFAHHDHHPSLVCCSKPHGRKPFVPAIIGSVALFLGAFCNNYCMIVNREAVRIYDNGAIFYGFPFTVGLLSVRGTRYTGQLEYDDNEFLNDLNNTANWKDDGFCSALPGGLPSDPYNKGARVFAAASFIIGMFAVAALWYTACIMYRKCTWRLINVSLLGAALFQGLAFLLFFRSIACTRFRYEGNALDPDPYDIDANCKLAEGGIAGVVSIALWLVCTVLTVCYPVRASDDTAAASENEHEFDAFVVDAEHNVRSSFTDDPALVVDGDGIEGGVWRKKEDDDDAGAAVPRFFKCLFFMGYRAFCVIFSVAGFVTVLVALIALFDFLLQKGIFFYN